MGLRVEDELVEGQHIIRREKQVEVLQRLGQEEALLRIVQAKPLG